MSTRGVQKCLNEQFSSAREDKITKLMQSKKYSSRQRERFQRAHNQLISLNPVLKIRLTISIADNGGGKEELYTLIFMQYQRHWPGAEMSRSNCSAPIPRAPGGTPGTSLFSGYLSLFITLFLPCPILIT